MSLKRLAFVTMLVTYILIVFGGYVASSQSGMGCGPEWPLCNGAFIPLLHGATLVEFTHRIIGVILAVLTVLLLLKVVHSNPSASVRSTSWWMVFLMLLQIFLGAVVVIINLPVLVITIHLLVAFTFLAIVIYLWRTAGLNNAPGTSPMVNSSERKQMLIHVNVIFILLLLTIALGGYIKHENYGLACGWLACGESWLPAGTAQIVQTVHRIAAAVTAVYILWMAFPGFNKSRNPGLRKRTLLAAIAVVVQVLLGIVAVMTGLQLVWAVGHLAAATALFAIIAEIRAYLLRQ